MKPSKIITMSLAVLAVALLASGASAGKTKPATFSNPLNVAFGAPFVLKASDGKYCMYGTSEREKGVTDITLRGHP